jgi:WD40 repeat protein
MASQPPLLAKFQEVARHTRIYTGGKVVTHVSAVDGAHGFFVCACGPELNVVDITTGRLLLVVPCDEDDFTAFALAPSGTELVTAGRSRQLRSWVLDVGVTTCEFTRVWKAHKMPVMDLAYDASGRFVASGSADSTAMVSDVAKGIATLKSRMPFADLAKFEQNPSVQNFANTLTVEDMVRYVQSKVGG